MTRLAVAALLAVMVGVGYFLRWALVLGRGAVTSGWSWGLDFLAGLVALHLVLLGCDLAGLPWSRTSLAVFGLALAGLGGVAGATGFASRRRGRAVPTTAAGPIAAPPEPSGATAASRSARLIDVVRSGWGSAIALATFAVYAALA